MHLESLTVAGAVKVLLCIIHVNSYLTIRFGHKVAYYTELCIIRKGFTKICALLLAILFLWHRITRVVPEKGL